MGPLSFRVSFPSCLKTSVRLASFSPSFCRISHFPRSSFAASSRPSAYALPTGSRTAQAIPSPRSVCMMTFPSSRNGGSLHPPVPVHLVIRVIGVFQFQGIAVELGLLGDFLHSPVLQLQLEFKGGVAGELVFAGQDVISNGHGCLAVPGEVHLDLDVLAAGDLLGGLPLADDQLPDVLILGLDRTGGKKEPAAQDDRSQRVHQNPLCV